MYVETVEDRWKTVQFVMEDPKVVIPIYDSHDAKFNQRYAKLLSQVLEKYYLLGNERPPLPGFFLGYKDIDIPIGHVIQIDYGEMFDLFSFAEIRGERPLLESLAREFGLGNEVMLSKEVRKTGYAFRLNLEFCETYILPYCYTFVD